MMNMQTSKFFGSQESVPINNYNHKMLWGYA